MHRQQGQVYTHVHVMRAALAGMPSARRRSIETSGIGHSDPVVCSVMIKPVYLTFLIAVPAHRSAYTPASSTS